MWVAEKTAPMAINIFTRYRLRKGCTITYEDNGIYILGFIYSSRTTRTKGIMYKVCPPRHSDLVHVGNDILLDIPASRIVCSPLRYYTMRYQFIEEPDRDDLGGTVVSVESDSPYMGILLVDSPAHGYMHRVAGIRTMDGVVHDDRYHMIYNPAYLPVPVYMTSTPPDLMVVDEGDKLSDDDSPLVDRPIRASTRVWYTYDSEIRNSYTSRVWHTKAGWKYRLNSDHIILASRILAVTPRYYSTFRGGYNLPDGTWVDFWTGNYPSRTYHRGQIYKEDNRIVIVSDGFRHVGLSNGKIDRIYMNGGERQMGTYPDGG